MIYIFMILWNVIEYINIVIKKKKKKKRKKEKE